ncbi:unnamed protein product [Ambrosiozyma monospora]|uniref:Unnamed protein product n=1 Tax=Ambrosiozyma monospora TaxID=43982 RepID=A0ACB5U1Y5_AMBMO|nr:unnamed protein product [Ambrosiozyma monospora]
MPRQIWTVNLGEFCAWIGYFPMLFYTTSYVGELYLHELGYNSIADIPSDLKQGILDESIRKGTHALLANSIVALSVDILLPYLVEVKHYDIRKLWTISHLAYILASFLTFFVGSSTQAVFLFALLGIPWGCAVWIPFVLIAEEISRIKDLKNIQISQGSETGGNSIYLNETLIAKYNQIEYDSGILLAIHNVFVSCPQMISSLGSSLLFKMLAGNNDSIGWCFRFGGLACIGALVFSLRIKSAGELFEEDKSDMESAIS